MIICPYLGNPDVARDFNELKNATSEAAAYRIWSLNNGNAIDRAPNGAPSKLFLTLLDYYEGDREKAIKAKAKVYKRSFFDWFGDWTSSDKKNVSKVVDENGEPLVVYHGTTSDFTTFSKEKLGAFTGAESAKLAFFTASNEELAKDIYAQMESNEHFYQRMLEVDSNFTKEDLGIGPEEPDITYEIYSEWSKYYNDLEIEYNDVIQELEKHRNTHKQTFSETISKAEEWVTDLGLEDYIKEGYAISDTQRKEYEEGKPITISKEIDVVDNINTIEAAKKLNTKRSREFVEKHETLDRELKEALEKAEIKNKQFYRNRVKALFLNIKNPKVDSDYGNYYRAETYAKRIKDAINNSNDGGIIRETRDPYRTDVYYFFEPNQAKSATDNNEKFSTENDDIRENRSVSNYINLLFQQLKDTNNNVKLYNAVYGTNFGYVKGIGYVMNKNPKWHGVSLHTINDKRISVRNMITIDKLRDHLILKFNLEYVELSDIDFNNQISSKDNCVVIGNVVYVRQSIVPTLTNELLIEEFLHPSIHAFAKLNPEEFEKLFNQAKEDFSDLWGQIQKLYEEKSEIVQKEELVTQVLSKYLNKEISENGENTGNITDYIKSFFDWIFNTFKDLFGNIEVTNTDNVLLSGAAIKNVINFEHLAQIFNIRNTTFNDTLDSDEIRENRTSSLNERVINIYDSIEQERNQYLDNVVNQYKTANPNYQPSDIARIQNLSRILFDKDRLERTLTDILTTIASSFGMFNYTQLGYYVAPDTMSEEQKGLYEYIINSLSQLTFERWRDNNNSKYNSVRPDTNVTLNVIHTAIYNGDLSTLDKHLADAYIRMFWNSELVQSGLKLVSDQQISISQREKLLVDAITNENYTSRYNNTTLLDYIANFWNRLKVLAQNLFAGRDLSDTAKQAIMTGLTSAYANTRDLEISQGIQVLYDREDGNFDSSKLLSEQDKNILARIKQGTETRLKSQLHRPIQETRLIQELKLQLELLNNKNEDSIEDIYDTIEDFLNKANSEINQTLRYIDQIKNDDIHTWDPIKLNYIKQDLIGFYSGLLKDVRDLFNVNAVSKRKTSVSLYNQAKVANGNIDLEAYAKQLLNDLNNLEEYYYKQTVKPYVHLLLVDFVNSEEGDFIESDKKALFIKTMEAFLEQDRRYGDLAAGELVLGMASRSRSPIIRIVERMMTKSEFARDRRVLRKGQELIRLYNKIRPIGSQQSPFNFLKLFIELDSEDGTTGLPTGYFIRKVNYGRFFREKDEFEAKLREEFASEGVTSVVNSKNGQIETVFPEEDTTLNNSVYNRYMDKLDEWLDKHCNRRYTLEYYKKRRRFLSRQAIEQTRSIQRQIDLIRQKSINELGLEDISTLTRLERQQLNKLYKQKQELSGAYKFTLVNGVLRLEEKVGDEAIIAKQIRDWNKHILGKVNYKSNEAKYNADLQLMINKYGANSQEVSSFIKDNTKWKISSDFFDELSTILPKVPQTAEYEDLKERHKQIMNRLVTGNTYYSYDMTLAGTGIRQDTSLWQELARIEQRMSDIRISSGQRLDPNNIPFTMKQIAFGNNQTYLNHIINEWRPEISNNSTLLSVFDSLFTYIDEKGARKYLKAFSYFTPVAASITTSAGNVINTIEKTYSPRYSELDESSEYVNENYDTTNDEVLQPIGYINKQFEKILKNADYLKFYNLLIDTMLEANSMIPTRALSRSYLMPQITGRGLSILARTSFGSNLFGALGYGVKDAFGLQFLELDMDASTNLDLPRRPDGTVVSNIPIRYVKRLPQPWLISTDVIGSIMAYYNMAVNYDEKSKNLPSLELINEAINPELSDQSNRMYKQRDKMANLLNFRYYGREDQSLTERKEILHTGKVDWTGVSVKTGKNVRRLASMSMLALNFTTIEVGYIDALLGSIADSVGGKFFTKSDLLYGYSQVLMHLPWMLANLGTPNTNDWMIAAMQYNQLSRSNSDLFEKSDVSRIHKLLVLTQMGGYTVGDYLINSMILAATYRHYRLITDVGTGKQKFMSRSEAIKMFMKYGYTEVEAVKQYESAKTTLRQAYKVVDGVLTLKDEYKDIVTKSLEDRIASRLRDRTAMYNGVIPAVEKAKIQQNVWGSYMTLMRNFYVNTYWERIHTGEDFLSDAEIDSNRQLSMITSDNAGYANFEQGESGNATYVSFLQGIFKYIRNVKRLITHEDLMKLNADQQLAVGRVMTEVGIIFVSAFLMLASIMLARKYDYDEDKDPTLTVDLIDTEKKDNPWWSIVNLDFKNFDEKFLNWARWKFALLSTRVFTERTTFYWPGTIKELISSPTTAISYLDNLEEVFNLWMDLFGINGHDKHEEIKQGGYKGMSRGTRDIMKITSPTGIHNLIRNWRTPGLKSTLNWYQRISPNSFLIPNKADQDKENKQNGDNTKGKSKRSGKVKAF